jgi:RimJ/RimL family protein N-acetyltransferase
MADDKPIITTQPALVGDKIYLRPATAEDIANTYHWFLLSDPATQTCRPQQMKTAAEPPEQFKGREKSPYQQQLIVVRKKDHTPVGRVSFFDFNPHNRSAELGIIIDPDVRRKGLGTEALKLLVGFLFNTRGLNKVYAQSAAFNAGARKLLEACGFRLDGTLRRHYFHQGEFHDGVIYSLLSHEYER